ncbi:hypothetical protein ALMP_00610 [Streptomyces sp. A012304]|nr:hypothetical protein ALMP_00610 [Streptomyces sp. A012304]
MLNALPPGRRGPSCEGDRCRDISVDDVILGTVLRAARERADISPARAAAYLKLPETRIRRREAGRAAWSHAHALALTRCYGLADEDLDELERLLAPEHQHVVADFGAGRYQRLAAVEERAAWWRSVTAERSSRPVAVLVDNAVAADQVRALLPGGRQHLLVVTSRTPLTDLGRNGAHHLLQPFSPAAAQEYLTTVAGEHRVAGDRQGAHAIASLAAGLPLSLALAGTVLTSHPDRSLAELATALTHRRQQVIASTHGLTPFGVAMNSSLSEAYWGLPRPSARIFRSMGHLSPYDLDAAVTAAVCGLPLEKAEEELAALAGAGLLITVREDAARGTVYGFHDEVRAYARHRAVAEATDGELDEQTRCGLDFYLATLTSAEYELTARRSSRSETPPMRPEPWPGSDARVPCLVTTTPPKRGTTGRRRVHCCPLSALDGPQPRTSRTHLARRRPKRPGPSSVRTVAPALHIYQPTRSRPCPPPAPTISDLP